MYVYTISNEELGLTYWRYVFRESSIDFLFLI